jgi:hypothetical protein
MYEEDLLCDVQCTFQTGLIAWTGWGHVGNVHAVHAGIGWLRDHALCRCRLKGKLLCSYFHFVHGILQ